MSTFWLICVTVSIQNALLWLECRHGDVCATGQCNCQQAVREAARYAPVPVRRTLQPSSSPYTPCAMNIHYRQAAARSQQGIMVSSIQIMYSNLNSQPKRPGDLDLLTLKVVSESHVTRATSVPILVFLGLSVLELGPMYATDVRRQTDRRQTKASLNASSH